MQDLAETGSVVESGLGVTVNLGAAAAPAPVWSRVRAVIMQRRFLLCLLAVESLLLFKMLDNSAFWIDEAINGDLGRNILQFGYPTKWDGQYLVESYFNVEATRGVVEITHVWFQYYLTALSLYLFGDNTVAARLPFVICGLLTVVALYYLARRLSDSERLAKLAALLLTFHTGFLVYSRSCRYFSLAFLFTVLYTLAYLRWSDDPSHRNLAAFTLTSVALFYMHYPVWPFLTFGMAAYLLVFDSRKEFGRRRVKQFIVSLAISVALILPWLIYARPLSHNITDWSGASYAVRLAMFFWKINTWIFPFIGLLTVLGGCALLRRLGVLNRGERRVRLRREAFLLLGIPLYLVVVILARHPMFSTQYTAHAIPFAVLIGAYLLLLIREHNRWVAAATLALLLSTNLLQTLPFAAIEKSGIRPALLDGLIVNPRAQFNSGTPLAHYLYDQLSLRSYLFEYLYFINHPYQHRLKALVEYLKKHADPSQVILVPWHDADAVRFYTDMKVVYHFKPTFTVEPIKALVYQPNLTLDWIVPNAYYEPDQPFFKYSLDEYERVYIECPKDYIYENEPNLDFFMWRTNPDAPQRFFILKRKAGAVHSSVSEEEWRKWAALNLAIVE